MLKRTVVDVSEPKDSPDRRRVITLTSEEESAVRAGWAANAAAVTAEAEIQAKRERFNELRREILNAQAAGELPDSVKVDEFKTLKTELGL